MSVQLRTTNLERTYTNAEFEDLPEFDGNYELIEGRLVERIMPGDEHGRIAQQLDRRITLFDPDEKRGLVWRDSTFDIGPGWEVVPDLAFVVAERVPQVSKKSILVTPDLVVEVHSPSDLRSKPEREEAAAKIKKYQAAGVRIIWAINPETQQIEVFHPNQDAPVKILGLNDELDGEDVLPGFKFKIVELFK